MKIILLVLMLIPIFTFQAFIFIDTISTMKLPARVEASDMEAIPFDGKKSSRRSSLKVIKWYAKPRIELSWALLFICLVYSFYFHK